MLNGANWADRHWAVPFHWYRRVSHSSAPTMGGAAVEGHAGSAVSDVPATDNSGVPYK